MLDQRSLLRENFEECEGVTCTYLLSTPWFRSRGVTGVEIGVRKCRRKDTKLQISPKGDWKFGFLLFFSRIRFVSFGLFVLVILFILLFLDNSGILEVKHLPGMKTIAFAGYMFRDYLHVIYMVKVSAYIKYVKQKVKFLKSQRKYDYKK